MADANTRQAILDTVAAATATVNSHKKVYSFMVNKNGYSGEFTVKYPALMDKMRIGTLRAKYLDGIPSGAVDVTTDNIAFMTATLMVVLQNAPNWFNIETLDDYEVLETIFDTYNQWYESFRTNNSKPGNEGSGTITTNAEIVENNENVPPSN